jgi:hypothetical protein
MTEILVKPPDENCFWRRQRFDDYTLLPAAQRLARGSGKIVVRDIGFV